MIYGKTITNKKRRKRLDTETILIYGAENAPKFIVKIHESGSIFIRKEIEAYNRVEGFENSVQMICNFSCLDDKTRWEHMIHTPIKFCNNKKDSLHFIVLEYIEDGDLSTFFASNPPKHVLCSFYLQLILCIATLSYTYRIEHGDLNSGNILIGKTDKSRMHYRIQNKEYRIHTYGITPKFVDYGRSKIYRDEPSEYDILDEVFIALNVISNYVKDDKIKRKLQKYTDEYNAENTIQNVLKEVRGLFI